MIVKRVFIIRHGETDYNVSGRWQGVLDVPLNPLGRTQAQLVSRIFNGVQVGTIYSSDLIRAYDTATAISDTLNMPIIKDERLREIHLGVFQGLTRQEIINTYPLEYNYWMNDDYYAMPRGESRIQLQLRLYAFWKEMLEKETSETIVLVSHGAAVRWLVNKLFGNESTIGRHFENTSVTQLDYADGQWQIIKFADVSHLKNQFHDDENNF